MKPVRKVLFSRATIVFLALALQLATLIYFVLRFQENFYLFYIASIALSVIAVLHILDDWSNPAYKLAWIVPILMLPIFGGIFYFFFGRVRPDVKLTRQMAKGRARTLAALPPREETLEEISASSPAAGRQSRYLARHAHFPPWGNTRTRYLESGEAAFECLKEMIGKAERYIFLEFFIVDQGAMLDELLSLLREKHEKGVDVRFIYDDFGCMGKLPPGFDRRLEEMGIRCAVFNRLKPFLTGEINHRDHRKIAVVDGIAGMTGGFNIADEYINRKPRFGHWKDTAIMVEGEAAWSLAVMFLGLWDGLRGEKKEYLAYRPDCGVVAAKGFVQPYTDSPLDNETVGENAYLNLAGSAQRYLYITTPYLILDSEMRSALELAAKGGVDVRIITPHIPDKKYVHAVTRVNYRPLLGAGVRVFEYGPGFIHSKTFVADDMYATVGTINLDYRSLYLHFECGVWMYGTDSILAIRDDFLRTQEASLEISAAELDRVSLPKKVISHFLKFFSPLL